MLNFKKSLSGIIILVLFFTVAINAEAKDMVDINTASLEELQKINGVEVSLAEKIIDNRPYESISDLKKVKEIKADAIEEIKS